MKYDNQLIEEAVLALLTTFDIRGQIYLDYLAINRSVPLTRGLYFP
jgi:hypothetical protein